MVRSEDKAADKIFDVVAECGQRVIDAISSEDVLRVIPVVKTAVAGAAAFQSIRDEILNRKLKQFLGPLNDVSTEERREMIARLEADPTYRRRVGEHVVEVLDRLDSHRKPRLAGEIFAAFARNAIDRKMLQRLLDAIDRLPALEIDTVRRFVDSSNNQPERDKIDQESIQAMMNAGFASSGRTSPIGGGRTVYIANTTCQKFVELDLDVRSQNHNA